MTSRYHGSKISGSQQQGVGSFATATENSKKAIGLDWQKSNFARASRFFVHFLAVVARLRPLYGVGENNTKIVFFFF